MSLKKWAEGIVPDASFLDAFLLSACLKLLIFPAYHSTDFEVHRNWLAITFSLPIRNWYEDTTSEWTLDYPPFFAHFEKLLSFFGYLVDPNIVDLHNLRYDAWSVVAFQRITVIISEIVLGAATLRFASRNGDLSKRKIIALSLFLHPGFFIVDHIHFQYNGFLFGILLWSILMARDGRKLASGILFAVLLNFKHIFLYLSPAYFIYLLRTFCLTPTGQPQIKNFLVLANAVLVVFAVSFAPFILLGQVPQVLARLFPFTRGLNHAYWAPNVWALITFLDRILLFYSKLTGHTPFPIRESGVSSTSRGLVGDTVFAIIPDVKPIHTFLITGAVQFAILIQLWFRPTYKSFVNALTLCGYASFLFGWHVHEKAILLVLIPLSLLAAENYAYFRTFMIVSVAGIFSLFPLLFTPEESIIEVVYSSLWLSAVYQGLSRKLYEYPKSLPFVLLDVLERSYLAGFPLILLASTILSVSSPTLGISKGPDAVDQANSLDFLPLMLTSVYCGIGVVWGFIRLFFIYVNEDPTYNGEPTEIK